MTVKETPLKEITLRRYEKPYDLKGRELTAKLCLSLGLLQPADSRDVIVDVLHVLLEAKKKNKALSSEEVKDLVVKKRQEKNMPLLGIASSNIRRQLKRLRDIFLIEKIKNKYRVTEFAKLTDIFEDKVEKFLLPYIVNRVKDYLRTADEEFS